MSAANAAATTAAIPAKNSASERFLRRRERELSRFQKHRFRERPDRNRSTFLFRREQQQRERQHLQQQQ